MRYDLHGLRSDTLAHILSAMGIASILRNKAKVGWDAKGKFSFIESDLEHNEIDVLLEKGLTRLRLDAETINKCYEEALVLNTNRKSQGNKGRKKNGGEDKSKIRGLNVEKISNLLDSENFSLREVACSMVSIVSAQNNIANKPRSMLGKSLLYKTAAEDLIKYDKMVGRKGLLTELASSHRMAFWIGNSKISSPKGVTGYDHIGNMINVGINQSELGSVKCPNPIVELLSIEGLKALPIFPRIGQNPRNRGMIENKKNGILEWRFPIWSTAISYLEIEDVLADSRPYEHFQDGIVEIRVFEIIDNGNLQMIRPAGLAKISKR